MSANPQHSFLAITPESYANLQRSNPLLPNVNGNGPEMVAVRTCLAHIHLLMIEAKASTTTPDNAEDVRRRLDNAGATIQYFALAAELADMHDACISLGIAVVNAKAEFDRAHPKQAV